LTLIETLITWAAAPIFTWGWSVEKRLAKLDALKEIADKTDSKVEKIYDHLIGSHDAHNPTP
jgi:hypothetical protein